MYNLDFFLLSMAYYNIIYYNMDISIIALIVSAITALGGVIASLHIRHCRSGCIDSDCFKSRLNTPIEKDPLLKS
jgi:hypothetical protein